MKLMRKFNKGFSLIELMIVVGIIGILATLAAPKLKTFQARAKQSEGKMMLNQIYTLQEAYSLENNAYVNYGAIATVTNWYGAERANGASSAYCTPSAGVQAANRQLGFTIVPCDTRNPRYSYNVDTATGVGYTATAETGTSTHNRVNPGCATADSMTIQSNRSFAHGGDSTKASGC